MSAQVALEGTWEEILAHSRELAGQKVRLIILADEDDPYPGIPSDERPSTAESLLRYAGTWVGDDLEECLKSVYENRIQASA